MFLIVAMQLFYLLSTCNLRASSFIWHARLGHPSFRVVSSLNKHGAISVSDNRSIDSKPCFGCQLGKSHRLPFSNLDQRCNSLFEQIHFDLWGPSPITSPSGHKYYCVLIDEFSRFSWFYPLKLKSDFFDIFVHFHKYVQTQFDIQIKSFQCDGGIEFTNHRFTSFLRAHGIIQRIACPYTPNQNGIAERKHRHITETGLTLMFHSNMPLHLWVDSFSTACYLINHLSSPILDGKSPYETLYSHPPSYSMLRTFGCLCFPFLRDYMPHKLSPRSLSCVFIGYSHLHKGFRCLDQKTNRVYISRHVQFFENYFPYASASSPLPFLGGIDYITFDDSFDPSLSSDTSTSSVIPAPRLASTSCVPCADSHIPSPPSEDFLPPSSSVIALDIIPSSSSSSRPSPIINHPMVTRAKNGIVKPRTIHSLSALSSPSWFQAHLAIKEPRGFKSAIKHPEWLSAMDDEIAALKQNNTWRLVPRPHNHNVVGCRWIFKTKL